MSRVLLTGATGFIGGRTAAHLRRAGHEVLCPVRRTSGTLSALEVVQLEGGFDAVTPQALAGVEVAIHAAATVGPDLEAGVAVNVEGTRRVLAACEQAGVPTLVHVSTTSVYDRPDSGDRAVTEETPLVPLGDEAAGVYARTKAEAERVLHGADATAVAILRPPAVLGAGPTSTWGRRIPGRVSAGEAVPLQRGSTFAFVHVDDLVDAILAAAGLDPDATASVPGGVPGEVAGGVPGEVADELHGEEVPGEVADELHGMRVANVVGGHVTVADYLDAVVDLLPARPPAQPGREETGWTGRFSTDQLPRLFGVAPYRSFARGMAEIANDLTRTADDEQERGS